ncbi:MAG: hypothetical protein K2Z80_14770 [Xanthobacteraceae bacterium]|nr:hypothetical protein [Xanthobacteraceae bacterium]
MMNVESYRQYAADCVRKAQGEETPEERNIVLNVALAWLRLARQTETMEAAADDSAGAEDESGLAAEAADDGTDEAGPGDDAPRLAS